MPYFEVLTQRTAAARAELFTIPVIADCLAGRVTRPQYLAFLTEAYHHVRHTVPLLMACGSRLPQRLDWLRAGLVEYIEEEHGHEQWILNDIDACGGDSAAAARRQPGLPTELMVSFVYDYIQRINPVGMFGMVYVLEGTSVAIATRAAAIIQERLGLPPQALSYLRSHGSVDVKHIEDYRRLVDHFDAPEDRDAVVHCARVVFELYGQMFRTLPRADVDDLAIAEEAA